MKGTVVKVALQGATFAYDKLYSYAVPSNLSVMAGCRVLVPFGKANLKKQGMVFEVLEDDTQKLKPILSVIDNEPVLNSEFLKMCEYMHNTVFCNYYDAVNAMLPTGITHKLVNFYSANEDFVSLSLLNEIENQIFSYLKKKGEVQESEILSTFDVSPEELNLLTQREVLIKNSDTKQKMLDATQKWVRLSDDFENIKITPRQKDVVELLRDIETASIKEIRYFTGVSLSVIENLITKGVLLCFEKQVFRKPYKSNQNPVVSEIKLTEEQENAYNGLVRDYENQQSKAALLYGVTGSGKTQVFLKLVDRVCSDNKGVIVMVPEIALTPQMINIFLNRYGSKIAVFHSAMSQGQRMDEWKRIKNGEALIAIGTRSAIFAPFKELGLIIIDEEQEHTYKSEKSPRFHTRDLAKFRTAYHKGLLCLASATPSIETFTKAKNGKYSLYTIKHRYGDAKLPNVTVVDMKKEILNGNSGSISTVLYEELNTVLENKKQAIILLNRRGHNTYISCPDCGYVATCPNCSISLTYHSANKRLMCHYCGHSVPITKKCPECEKEHMKFLGLGTQKAQQELQALFPKARILRLDADSTVSRDSYSKYLNDFANGEYDILLGTQMVAKGLDFPNVTLVGVLGADGALYSEDFKSFERTFSLLTQVVGRAGRGQNEGKAIIQTINPENNIIELAKNQDFESFYNSEIMTRQLLTFPPYCDICYICTISIYREEAITAINGIFDNIREMINNEYKDVKIIVLGPTSSAIAKINNRYRFRMMIKCKNNKRFRELLKKAIDIKLLKDVSISVDFNPETVI
ncbi:MAG: primosomal protein N' [Ruminococcaceae bacterium]|nr:primosomal protein N' [Oscillospiraceae bacterium]